MFVISKISILFSIRLRLISQESMNSLIFWCSSNVYERGWCAATQDWTPLLSSLSNFLFHVPPPPASLPLSSLPLPKQYALKQKTKQILSFPVSISMSSPRCIKYGYIKYREHKYFLEMFKRDNPLPLFSLLLILYHLMELLSHTFYVLSLFPSVTTNLAPYP